MASKATKTTKKEGLLLSSPMLDGLKLGIDLGEEESAEIMEFRSAIEQSDLSLFTGKNLLGFKLQDQSTLTLSINRWRNRSFFNLEGNPISFLYGDNQVGTTQLSKLIYSVFRRIKHLLKEEHRIQLPGIILKSVKSKEVFIHSFAFATYTNPLESLAYIGVGQLISSLAHLYQFVDLEKNDPYRIGDELGVRVIQEGPTSLRFERISFANVYWTLGIYDKGVEQQSKGKSILPDINNRLRLDLTLKANWLKKSRFKTLSDICNKYEDNYEKWVNSLFIKALSDLKLDYVLAAPKPFESVVCGNYRKAFGLYKKGKPMGKEAIAFFNKQGFDFSLSCRFHYVAKLAHLTLGMPIELKMQLLDNPVKAGPLVNKWLETNQSTENFEAVIEVLRSLEIDTDFPKYRPSEI